MINMKEKIPFHLYFPPTPNTISRRTHKQSTALSSSLPLQRKGLYETRVQTKKLTNKTLIMLMMMITEVACFIFLFFFHFHLSFWSSFICYFLHFAHHHRDQWGCLCAHIHLCSPRRSPLSNMYTLTTLTTLATLTTLTT